MHRESTPVRFERTVRVLYACRACKRAGAKLIERVTYRIVGEGEEIWYLGRMTRSGTKAWFLDDLEVHRDSLRGEGLPGRSCPRCVRPLSAERVHGRINNSIPCGPRCRNATGPNCECACGGANHGASYG